MCRIRHRVHERMEHKFGQFLPWYRPTAHCSAYHWNCLIWPRLIRRGIQCVSIIDSIYLYLTFSQSISPLLIPLPQYYLKRLGLAWESLSAQWRSSNRAADLRAPEGEDEDVQAERTRVKCEIQKLSKDSAVVTTNLRKCYGEKVAVQNLTLGR